MAEMIRDRRAAIDKVERHDLLSRLLEANDHDLDLETLSENEIISMLLILHSLTMLT
jgi:cytochrome P450